MVHQCPPYVLVCSRHHGFTSFLQLVPASSPCSLLGLFLAANLIALPRASFPEAAWVGNMHEKLVSACCGWSRQATGVGHLVGTLAFVAMTLFRWGSSLPSGACACLRIGCLHAQDCKAAVPTGSRLLGCIWCSLSKVDCPNKSSSAAMGLCVLRFVIFYEYVS